MQLLPCPFCGGQARVTYLYGGAETDPHFVECSICGARIVKQSLKEALAAWRNRAARQYPLHEDKCPGHVSDTKICARCGTHIDELRPPEDDE